MTAPPIIPVNAFSKRFHHFRKLPLDVIDFILFLPAICLVCALGIVLRLIGPLFIVIPVGFCLLYATLRRTVPPGLLSVYLAFCAFIAILSKYQLLPTSWQVHFMQESIVRQLTPLLGYFATVWASKAYFRRRLLSGNVFAGGRVLLVLSLVVAPTLMFLQGAEYQGQDPELTVVTSFGSLINNNLVALFFVFGGIFLTRDWRHYLGLVFVLSVAATTHFTQFKILAFVALVTVFGAPGRIAAIAVVIAMPVTYAIKMRDIPAAMIENPNSGIRLAFVADAVSSAIDTNGIGVGYGKESVRWRYEFANMPAFTFLPDPMSMTPERMLEALSTGVENSFAEALMRTGMPGFLLFVAAFFVGFPPRNLPRNVRNHAAMLFSMTFIGCFVNSALESPISAVGHAFVFGYLLALRANARGSVVRATTQQTLITATRLSTRFVPLPQVSKRGSAILTR